MWFEDITNTPTNFVCTVSLCVKKQTWRRCKTSEVLSDEFEVVGICGGNYAQGCSLNCLITNL
jgi:hypothetical protein